jgi:hypothetical protein
LYPGSQLRAIRDRELNPLPRDLSVSLKTWVVLDAEFFFKKKAAGASLLAPAA